MSDTIDRRSVNLEAAQRVIAAAIEEAMVLGVAVNVAVVDVAGDVVAFARMDDAALLSADIARDKAWTVARFKGVPTHDWWDMIKDDDAVRAGIVKIDRFMVFAGGVPIVAGGGIIGAVGVSGASADEDRRIAEAGAAAVR